MNRIKRLMKAQVAGIGVVEIILILLVLILLVVLFKDQLQGLVKNIFKSIEGQVTTVESPIVTP